jgi:hypothetical protein
MKSEDHVQAALQTLAAHDCVREASEETETRVLQAFRRRKRRKVMARAAAWTLAAAATVAAGFYSIPRRPASPAVVARPAPQLAAVTAPAEPAPEPAPVRRSPPAARSNAPREVVTPFFPLMDTTAPIDRGLLLRVTVPAGAMRAVGLPVNEDRINDRVQADVLVGEEGLARAIRFVKYEQ